jgi:hypothetical protein
MAVPFIPQADGGPLQWVDCGCACGAMQVALETGGASQPTASEFRSHVREPDGSPDVIGGTRPSQIVDAARRGFDVILDARAMPFEAAWTLGQNSEYGISFSISYSPISGTVLDGSPGFRGNHQVLLSGGLVSDPLADGRRHGIPNGPMRWTKAILRDAAGRLNVAGRGQPYRALGQGRALVIVARGPEVKPRRFSLLFEPGNFFQYRLGPNGWERSARRFDHPTSAPCEAPITIPWLEARKRVALVTAGPLAGTAVEPGATHIALKEAR